MIMYDVFTTRDRFDAGHGHAGDFSSLRRLEQQSGERISRLPVSLRIILESILRNHDGVRITEQATTLLIKRNGRESTVPLTVRIDTPIEAEYFRHGGILLYVLRQLIGHQSITLN